MSNTVDLSDVIQEMISHAAMMSKRAKVNANSSAYDPDPMSLDACKKPDNWEYPKQRNSWKQEIDNLKKFDVIIPLSSVPSDEDFLDRDRMSLLEEPRQALPNTEKWTNESAECVLAGTRRSKAFTTTELMHMHPCLHGQRLNCSLLLPDGIVCSSKHLIASQRTSRPISRILCMYTHRKD